jgi:hypothetical protein
MRVASSCCGGRTRALLLLAAAAAASDDAFAGGAAAEAWATDPATAREMAADGLLERCDLPSVDAAVLSDEEFLALRAKDEPFLVRNLIDTWPAHQKWTKAYLRDRFGQLTSNSGIERQRAESIKTFGLAILDKYDNSAHETVTLEDYLLSLPNRTDVEFLFGDIASQMLADASNPRIFSELGMFGTDEDVMVSIAPSRAGFPLHAHGRSWMVRVRPAVRLLTELCKTNFRLWQRNSRRAL